MMWLGPKLKFERSRVKLEDVAALLFENWGGDRWGHVVQCSPLDYFQTPRPYCDTTIALWGVPNCRFVGYADPNEQISVDRFILRPCDDVPVGEVWLRSL